MHSSISQLPLADQIKTRNAADEITGEGEVEGRAHSGRDSLVGGGGGAGHPIATIYFPSAARNTSGQEEREGKKEGEGRRRSRVNK